MTSVETLLSMLRSRKGKLPFEVGAFIALQAAERLVERPVLASAHTIFVAEDGSVVIDEASADSTGEDTAQGLHGVLEQLLLAAGAGVPARMLEYVDQGAPRGPDALERMRDALESSLVPLNRAASKRVIARVLRDAERDAAPLSRRPPAFTEAQVDADFDALMGGSAPAPARVPAASEARAPVPAQEPVRRAPAPEPSREAPRDEAPRARPQARDPEQQAAPRAPKNALDFDDPPKKKKSPAMTLAALLAAVFAIGGFTAIVRPELFGLNLDRRRVPEAEPPPRTPPAPAERTGTLTVNVPEGAQVLLFVGRGPARVERLPIGVAHELVVVADGRAPSRTVLPKDAEWPPAAGTTRSVYELALQAGAEVDEALALDVGASQLTAGNMGTPSGRFGDIRVITNPPAARVFLMVGFGPEVVIRGIEVDAATELLVYAPRTEPERVVIAPSDYAGGADGLAATRTVTLRPRARGR